MTESKTTRRLVLLDAHAIIHRAYHALPDFTSDSGEPTGALYGLSMMLMRIIQDLKPDYIIAAYDLKGKTHRHDVYEEYKGTRKELEEALVMQIDRSREVFRAFEIPIYDSEGFEADDVLGTIVEDTKKEKGLEVIIASGDMDTLQLVDGERVKVYTTRKGLSDIVVYDEDKVVERYGFGPEYIPDLKGLMGDASDNIKGVRGVGEGSAVKLIGEYGTLEKLFGAIKKSGVEKISEKTGVQKRFINLIADNEEDALFSRSLATIKRDAPIAFSLPKKKWRDEASPEKVLALFHELSFRTLADRFRGLVGGGQGDAKEDEKERRDIPEEMLDEMLIALWLLRSDMTNPAIEDALQYANERTLSGAHKKIFGELAAVGRLSEVFEKIEKPLIPVVRRMQENGIALNTGYLETLSRNFHKELDGIQSRIYKLAGREFNINSPRQLGEVLFDELGVAIARQKKTGTGQRSTRESELEKMRGQHPAVGEVLAYREGQKLLSTYIDALPRLVGTDGRIHATFLQAGTTTGRMASQNPNLQNIPTRADKGKNVRDAFVAGKGKVFLALDYSQVELRIAAALSGDEKLSAAFKEGKDIHRAVAADVFGVEEDKVTSEMRRRAKVINFGILYGMGVNALRVNLGDNVSRSEASEFLSAYFHTYRSLARYIEDIKALAARQGFTETLFGRRRYFAGLDSSLPYVRAQAERMAVNAPIQGTQADIIKLAMIKTDEELEKKNERADAALVLQVHDELVFEVSEKKAEKYSSDMARIMESVAGPELLGGVPIAVDASVGEKWGSMKHIRCG